MSARPTLGPLVHVALVVAVLAIAKPVLLPIALAFYFAFVLTPPAQALERLGLPRALSVAGVVGMAVAVVAVLGATLASQVADLAGEAQAYSIRMSHKLEKARAGQVGVLDAFDKAMNRLGRALDPDQMPAAAPVRLVDGDHPALQQLEEAVLPLLQPVALAGVVLVLTVFVLVKRDDLRGRLIQLVGTKNVTVTTQTIDEVAARISRFLLSQAYINAGFGAVIAVGLTMIGLPYALLWGALAGVLRFVPYIGSLVALCLPALLAFATYPGWSETLMTLALFVGMDLVVAHFLEPVLLGRRTGVSAFALVVSALFWTWLWGPLGLLLSTPITVCAAAVGRHLPQLGFLAVLLGDEPALGVDVNFYQRILAGAVGDALRLAKRHPIPAVFDQVLVPAVRLMVRDQDAQVISTADATRVTRDLDDVIARVRPAIATPGPRTVALAAESAPETLLVHMLAATRTLDALPLLDRAAAVAAVVERAPDVVVIAALAPSGLVNARYVCRRLRTLLPGARLIVWVPAASTDHGIDEASARLREAGATRVVHTLAELASDAEPVRTAVTMPAHALPSTLEA